MCTRLQKYFGAATHYIDRYRGLFQVALDGEATAMLLDARNTCVSCLNPSLSAFL